MVFLNFSDRSRSLRVPFPRPVTYVEVVDKDARAAVGAPPYEITVGNANEVRGVQIPSNYGCIFIRR